MIKKIADLPQPCLHPEHRPPMQVVLKPGIYEHTCPACGVTSRFQVPRVFCCHDGARIEIKGEPISPREWAVLC